MRTVLRVLVAAAALSATALGPLASDAGAALGPDAGQPPAQWWGGGFAPWVAFGPDPTSPYAGSPGYPYYRYGAYGLVGRSEEHTSELQSRFDLVCRLLLEKKNRKHR